MKRIFRNWWALFLFFAAILSLWGCEPGPKRSADLPLPSTTAAVTVPTSSPLQPTSAPTQPAYTLNVVDDGAPLAPRVIARSPAGGGQAQINGSLQVSFDQPMDASKTSGALQVTDDKGNVITGEITWPSERLMSFKPGRPLQSGVTYFASLGSDATSSQGLALQEPFEFSFTTVEALKVSQVFPAATTMDVASDAKITVIFNRPVAPLLIAEQQADLPQPVQIDPQVAGKGHWVSTSVYTFEPEGYWAGGTTYQVSIAAGLKDAVGETQLDETYSWYFSTANPDIESFWLVSHPWDTNPADNRANILLDPAFSIRFLQKMDRASVEAAVSVTSQAGERAPLAFTWSEQDTQVVISTTRRLSLGTNYTLHLGMEAQEIGGASLRRGLDWHFSTVLPPAILYTTPADGVTQVEFDAQFWITFASLMRLESIQSHVKVTPEPTGGVQWYLGGDAYYAGRWYAYFYGLEPSTNYTVEILPGMEDIYGNQIAQGQKINFRTASSPPSAYLAMPHSDLVLMRSVGPQDFYVSARDAGRAEVNLYRMPAATYVAMQDYNSGISAWNYSPPAADLVWRASDSSSTGVERRVLKRFTPQSSNDQPLEPGFYFLTLNAQKIPITWKNHLDSRILLVASANLTVKSTDTEVMIWATDLTTGDPLPGLPVAIYDAGFNVLKKGVTGADGTVIFAGLRKGPDWYATFYAMSEGPEHFGFVSARWGSGVTAYDFGLWQDYYSEPSRQMAYVYTDRPLYRPGQPVYFKGVVRVDKDVAFSLPDVKKVEVIISSYTEVVSQQLLALTPYGSFSGEFLLDENAALGDYTIYVKLVGGDENIGQVNFGVAEYRKPEFLVDVSMPLTDLLAGGTFQAKIAADYYAGGAVSNADVKWSLLASPFSFNPPDDYSMFSFDDFSLDAGFYEDYYYQSSEYVANGEGQTDENGELLVTLPAELSKSGASQELTLEVGVTDFAGSTVGGRAPVVIHRSAVYPGIRMLSYVGKVNKEQEAEIVALDWNGNPIPGQVVKVEVVERRWYSVQEQDAQGRISWTSSVEEIPQAVFENIILDDKGKASVRFTLTDGGVYRVRVTALDAAGNQGKAATFLWVAGEDYIPWRQSSNRSFDLVKDRAVYSPGDTAEILIASPFQEPVYALVSVERGRVRSFEVILLQNNSTIYKLPITVDMAPDVYVSVLLIHGADAGGAPDFRQSITQLKVNINLQTLKVEIIPDRVQASPGETVHYTIRTTDLEGKPVSAEVSLALSDLAALSLADPNSIPILNYFYYERGLAVWTSVPILFTIEDFNAELAAEVTQGLAEGSGGGKGDGEEGVIKVRGNFLDTAYWNAHVQTDQNGEAVVSVTLPDNLTTWRMDARAVTVDTRLGQAQLDIVSTKPLLVRPQTPRFFVVGDNLLLGAAVHNNTDEDLAVTASLDATGVTLLDEAAKDVSIAAHSQAYVTWSVVTPQDSTRVDLVFTAVGGSYSDASLPTLGSLEGQGIPVYKFEAPETVGTSGQLLEGGTIVEAISLPLDWDITRGELTVEIAPTLAAGMTDALNYLQHYPYECIEQTISRFLPNVITTSALKQAGLSDPELESSLAKQINTSLQRLYNWQNPDGGWGWWGLQKSDPLTTAYVLLGLVEAQDAGYVVSQDVIDRSVGFVFQQLKSIKGLTKSSLLNRQAFLLYVLTRAGETPVSQAVQLYEERQNMSLYGRAYLAHVFFTLDANDPRLQTLLSDFASAAILSATGTHWEEDAPDYYNWNTDTRTTAIVLLVLSEIDPKNQLNANAVRWLMAHRRSGYWRGTQETAWSLMALTKWMVASGELQADYEYGIAFNGERLGGGYANAETMRETYDLSVDIGELLLQDVNRLAIARSDGSGNLYYTAHLNVWLPVEQIQALDQGIQVQRSYYQFSDPETPVTAAQQGDVLVVRLTIVAPNALHYVVIDDPLPAGLETVDEELKTSSKAEIPTDFRWDMLTYDGWGWWYFEHAELRDERLVLSASYLPAGTYVYTYVVRASTPGVFRVIPPTAQEFYFPEVYGRGAGSLFEVKP